MRVLDGENEMVSGKALTCWKSGETTPVSKVITQFIPSPVVLTHFLRLL